MFSIFVHFVPLPTTKSLRELHLQGKINYENFFLNALGNVLRNCADDVTGTGDHYGDHLRILPNPTQENNYS